MEKPGCNTCVPSHFHGVVEIGAVLHRPPILLAKWIQKHQHTLPKASQLTFSSA